MQTLVLSTSIMQQASPGHGEAAISSAAYLYVEGPRS